MIDYTYNTTSSAPETHGEESKVALIAAETAQAEQRKSHDTMSCAHECLSFQVSDSGVHHAGLRVSLRVWTDGIVSPELDQYYRQHQRNDAWLRIATACLSERQARELAKALMQAVAIREFDDGD